MRAYAQEKGLFQPKAGEHHSAEDYEDEFDRKVDMGMREKLESQEKWILEAWLSGFLAQGVPDVLKVLIKCSDEDVRIDRVVNRDKITVDEAKHHLFDRYRKNLAKWSRMYSQEWRDWVVASGTLSAEVEIDFWDEALYDVVIDTHRHNQEQTLQLVLDALNQPPTS